MVWPAEFINDRWCSLSYYDQGIVYVPMVTVSYSRDSDPQEFGMCVLKCGCELLIDRGSHEPLLDLSKIKKWLSPGSG